MIDKLTKDFLKRIVTEINEEENKIMINNNIIAPIWKNFTEKVFPYISLLFILYLINFIIIIIILIIILNKKKD
jgi:hypothetical protein